MLALFLFRRLYWSNSHMRWKIVKTDLEKTLQFTEKGKHATSSFIVSFGISSGVAVCEHE